MFEETGAKVPLLTAISSPAPFLDAFDTVKEYIAVCPMFTVSGPVIVTVTSSVGVEPPWQLHPLLDVFFVLPVIPPSEAKSSIEEKISIMTAIPEILECFRISFFIAFVV